MKKTVAVLSLLLVLVLAFTACSKSERPLRKEADVKVVTPQNEEKGGTTEAPAPAEAQPNPQNGGQNSNEDKFIGEERARQIALERAGLGADEVIFERVELDFDDGIWEYEVEFRQGRTEYSADIKADDGTIVSWEKDIDD